MSVNHMTIIKKSLKWLTLLALPAIVMAGTNPIQWVMTQAIPPVVFVPGGTYVASYTFTNKLPMTLAQPLVIEKTTNSPSEFTYTDLCTGQRLAHLQSCTVTIHFNPTIPGDKSIYLTQAYGHDRVPLPALLSTASGTSAGTDVSGTPTTELTTPLGVNDSAPWLFTFTNNGAEPATGVSVNVTGASYSTTCGNTLGSTPCTVSGTYTATSTGSHTITATLSYSQGAPVVVSTSTNGAGENGGLVCTPAVGLASQTLINSSTPVTLLCTNKTGHNINITNKTTSYPAGGPQGDFVIAGPGDNNCNPANNPLTYPNSCQLNGTYDAPANPAAPVTISIDLTYNIVGGSNGLTASTQTSTAVVSQINNKRTIHLVNNCNFNVWWSMVGGALTNSIACTGPGQCPVGSTCNVSAKLCYYNNYGPTTGGYQLNAGGGTATTQVIETLASNQASDDILWKGLISGSTQCTSGVSCLNNDCSSNGGTASCEAGVGFAQPATEAEFTFKLVGSGTVDSYDISNVNGFSMPISMSTSGQSVSDYTCGNAGNNVAVGNLSACTYTATPPTNMYYWVPFTGTACTAQNTCTTGGQICGLAFDPSTNGFTKNCGDFLGFWAANQICQTSPGFTSPFGDNFACNQYLASPFPPNTYQLTQLLKCSPPDSTLPLFNSCYLDYTGSTPGQIAQCCGCSNWSGIAYPTANCPIGQTDPNKIDPQWSDYVLPLIQWMKESCPTSYAYTYDDVSSSFSCAASPTTEYTITFCPGGAGVTGLPAGKTDGR